MASERVAVVTGSNKGIGYAIVKGLCRRFEGIVYLTARNEDLGHGALDCLKTEIPPGDVKCSQLLFHQLDITDKSSIQALHDHLKSKHGGLDILVNNAGIAFKMASTAPFAEQAEVTNRTNYFGTIDVCHALFPLLRPHARVVHVGSQAGLLKIVPGEDLRQQIVDKGLTVEKLSKIVEDFIKFAKEGTHQSHGYPNSSYGMSKVAVNALAAVHQRQFDLDKREDLIVNSCCPGYVDTDMSSHKGPLSPDEGAITPLYLALLPPNDAKNPKGKFYSLLKEVNWEAVSKV